MYIKRPATEIILTSYPIVEELHDNDLYIMGDAHSNALYILNFLLQKNVVKTTQDIYQQFATLYFCHKRHLAILRAVGTFVSVKEIVKDLANLKYLITKISINQEALNKNIALCFIGDELADRGANDLFVLYLFKILMLGQINFKICISNHGLEFLLGYYSDQLGYGLGAGQSDSMINLALLIELGIISKEEINQLYQQIYFPRLVAISYKVDKKNNQIVIMTHGSVPVGIIDDLCTALKLSSQLKDLPTMIDAINQQFSEIITNKEKLLHFFPQMGCIVYNSSEPFDSLIWCRLEDKSDPTKTTRPERRFSYKIIYIHGHHNKGHVASHLEHYIYNLDGFLGMFDVINGLPAYLTISSK